MRSERLRTRTGISSLLFGMFGNGAEIPSLSSSARWLIDIHFNTKLGRGWGQWLPAIGKKQNNLSLVNPMCYGNQVWPLMWVQRGDRIWHSSCHKHISALQCFGKPGTSDTELMVQLWALTSSAGSSFCSSVVGGDGEACQSHSMYLPHAKKLFPNVWVAATTSSCHIFQTSSSLMCLCFILQALWWDCRVEITASNIRGTLCSSVGEAGFPGTCSVFLFNLYSRRLSSWCIPVCLTNSFSSSVLLSSPSNKSLLSSCFLNAEEPFFT